jgi:hypothetical protein
MSSQKILQSKAYGSIPHLSKSKKLNRTDKTISWGHELICTQRARDTNDTIITSEKLDGSCVCVYRENDTLYPLGRSGYPAYSSPYKQHIYFDLWVRKPQNTERFMNLLENKERVVGEWLIQAHGTKYDLHHEPFVAFDIFDEYNDRLIYLDFLKSCILSNFVTAKLISYGPPISITEAYKRAMVSGHGATEKVEGVVWRVERENKVEFLAKYVIPEKVDGKYFKGDPVWNTFEGEDIIECYIK